MILGFHKLEATGNDFIFVIEEQVSALLKERSFWTELVCSLCMRRFGIGADGLLVFGKDSELDFKISYFNADGSSGMLCGNGARAAIWFAHKHLVAKDNYVFRVGPQIYRGLLHGTEVVLQLPDTPQVHKLEDSHYYANTGAPHKVLFFAEPIADLDLVKIAQKYRYGVNGDIGANVNLVYYDGEFCHIRTFEKGVEAETLSCGTGSLACALAWAEDNRIYRDFALKVNSAGGILQVRASWKAQGFDNIELLGEAREVFQGFYPIKIH